MKINSLDKISPVVRNRTRIFIEWFNDVALGDVEIVWLLNP